MAIQKHDSWPVFLGKVSEIPSFSVKLLLYNQTSTIGPVIKGLDDFFLTVWLDWFDSYCSFYH